MKTFVCLAGFVGSIICSQDPDSPKSGILSVSDDDTLSAVSYMDILQMRSTTTCDATKIKERSRNFDLASDVEDVLSCINLCVEQSSFSGIHALIEVTDEKYKTFCFEHAVYESIIQNKAAFASCLLTAFQLFPLSIEVFEKARKNGCKDVLPYLIQGWRLRYPSATPLDVMDEIVASCINFQEYQLLYVLLCGFPYVSAGTIKAFEDAVISNNIPVGSAILQSGVLGYSSDYAKMSPGSVMSRQSKRAKAFDLVSKGAVYYLHPYIGDIEIPFIIQMLQKSVKQPRSFIYLIERFASSLLKAEAQSIFKAACTTGDKYVFRHAFKVISSLRYDIPLVFLALQNGPRLNIAQVIHLAVSLQYLPQEYEVANCISLKLNDPQVIIPLLKNWAQHLCVTEVYELFPKLIGTENKDIILAAIKLFRYSHMYCDQRFIAYALMGENNHRGLALQQRPLIQDDPVLLRAVLSTVDPGCFKNIGYGPIEYYVSYRSEETVKTFLSNSPRIFHDRIRRCMTHLSSIKVAMKQNCLPDPLLVTIFIRDGGSWEELALLACKSTGQEMLLRMAMESNGANPFIVDYNRTNALLELPNLSEECKDIVWRAQKRSFSSNPKLILLRLILPSKDVFFLIVEKYRQITIEAYRRVFNYNS